MQHIFTKDRIQAFFFGKNADLSLENRLFIATMVIGEIIAATGIFLNLAFDTKAWALIGICVAVLAVVFTFHYFIRFKGIIEPFKLPVFVISFAGMAGIWMTSSLTDAPTTLMASVILMLNLAGAQEKKKVTVLLMYLILLVTVHVFQYLSHGVLYARMPGLTDWTDSFVTNLFCASFIYMIVGFIEREYNSEKKKAAASERKFQSLVESSQDFIIRFDRDHKLSYVNIAWKDSTGHRGEVVSLDKIGFFDSEQNGIGEAMLEKTFNTGSPQSGQFSKILSTGITYYNCRLFPEFDKSQNVVSVLGVFRDITDLKNSELELKRLNADKDKFISTLAHDLKSPFQTILGFLEMLKENFRNYNAEEVEQELGYIYDAAKNHFNLLDDLLAWSISNSGKLPFSPISLNLREVCTNALEILTFYANTKQIKIDNLIDAEIRINADERMLKTVLRNLVSNAIKFSNKGGQVSINCREVPSGLEISVVDNGVGIEKERLSKLFEPTRCNTTRGTADEKGTGLGLLLCKEFVEKHGGKIWVMSEKNQGSDFRFSIPAKLIE